MPVNPWWREALKELAVQVDGRMQEGEEKHGSRRPIAGKGKCYYSALLRHLESFQNGDRSEDHLTAVVCNALVLKIQLADVAAMAKLDGTGPEKASDKAFRAVAWREWEEV